MAAAELKLARAVRGSRPKGLFPGRGARLVALGGQVEDHRMSGHPHYASKNRTCFLCSSPARWTTALSRVTSARPSRTAKPSR